MLSETEQRIVEKYLHLSCAYCQHPFDWNAKDHRLQVTQSWFKYGLTVLHFLYTLLQFGFLSFRLVPGHGYDPHIIGAFSHVAVYHIFWLGVFGWHIAFKLSSFFQAQETVYFVNEAIGLNEKFGPRFIGRRFLAAGSKFERAFLLFDRWMVLLFSLLVVAFLVMPDNLYYLHSLVPPAWRSFGVLMFFLAVEVFNISSAIVFYMYACLVAFLYLMTTKFWLRKACGEWLSNPKTLAWAMAAEASDTGAEEYLEDPDSEASEFRHKCVLKTYRSLAVLNTLYNRTFGRYSFPSFKTGCEVCMMICLYGMVRTINRLPFQLYVFQPALGLMILLEHMTLIALMADVHENSSGLRKNFNNMLATVAAADREMKENGEEVEGVDGEENSSPSPGKCTSSEYDSERRLRLLQQKSLRACRPLRCIMGGIYFMDRPIKIRLTGMIAETVLLLLISL